MPDAELPTEAPALAWAVQVGLGNWEEVVTWADGWILRLDVLPGDLLELSLSARKPNETFTLLRRLAQRGDPDAALSLLAGGVWEEIDRGHADALVLAGRLADIAALGSDEEPDDVRLPPPSPSFRDAAWLLYAISVERGTDDEEEVFDRNLTEEVLTTLQRFH